jgi:hypothetical protein
LHGKGIHRNELRGAQISAVGVHARQEGGDGQNAFRWTKASGMQLLSIPGVASPDTYAAVDGANADGTVIVGYVASKTSGTATDPVVWDLSG